LQRTPRPFLKYPFPLSLAQIQVEDYEALVVLLQAQFLEKLGIYFSDMLYTIYKE